MDCAFDGKEKIMGKGENADKPAFPPFCNFVFEILAC